MSEQLYFVVDFRKEWLRQPYLSLWGPDHAGYCWSLPRAGCYTAAQLDNGNGYTTQRRWSVSRSARVGPWERFGVPCDVLEGLASEGDTDGRYRLGASAGLIVRNSAALRKRLTGLRYVPRATQPPIPTTPSSTGDGMLSARVGALHKRGLT